MSGRPFFSSHSSKLLVLTAALSLAVCSRSASVNVLTYHNDFARTGQNTNETVLTPANVNTNTFGKIFAYTVDGQVFAQPLYVSGLAIPGQGTHNVVFVATMHDSVYAFDADSNLGANNGLLWHVNLGTSAVTPNNDFGNRYGAYHDTRPEVGIIGTPVIDLAAGTLYLDAFTHEGTNYVHRIHALSLTTGAEQPNSPVVVSASIPGRGVGSSGGILPFDPMANGLQRPALTLAAGVLYVAYSGFADTNPYHGWLLGFNASTLQQLTNCIFNTTPNGNTDVWGANAGEGGLWMGGNGPLVDAATNLYFEVANGNFDLTNGVGTEYGDSFMKLSTTNGLAVADYFTPYNQASLSSADSDLGSGGPVLLPDSVGSASHPHLLLGAGKAGTIYLIDRDNMGHFNSANDSQIVQSVISAIGASFATPAYFNKTIYYQGNGDRLKAFAITNGALSTSPIHRSSSTIPFPGATPSVSANFTNNAIVWVLDNGAVSSGSPTGPAVLHAFNAYNLTNELYNSSQAGTRDTAAWAVKTTVPTVVNGKVYVGGAGALSVYGTGTFIAIPTISPAGGYFTNSVTVTLADATPGVSLYYTLDNSTPSTNSTLYVGSFVLTNTAAVKVFAVKPGAVPAVASAAFINSASFIFSPGFVKQEFYSGATRTNLESGTYTNAPTFVSYVTSFETPSGQGNNYAERVSGLFIAPQTTDYVFFVASDDDSDLFLSTDSSPANKHLIAQETKWSNSRNWLTSGGGSTISSKRSDQFTGTTWPTGNTISLTAGTQYYLEGVHHQGNGGDAFAATFIFSGAPDPADGTAPALVSSLLAVYAYNNTYITITAPPQNAAVNPGTNATFAVSALSGYLGDPSGVTPPPISYQWQSAPFGSSTFAGIPGATATSYTTPLLTSADDGSQFRAALATVGSSATSAVARLTVGQLRFNSISLSGGQVTLQWSGNALLQETTNLAGIWITSPNQSNPQTIPVSGTKFFRLRQ